MLLLAAIMVVKASKQHVNYDGKTQNLFFIFYNGLQDFSSGKRKDPTPHTAEDSTGHHRRTQSTQHGTTHKKTVTFFIFLFSLFIFF